MHFDYVWLFACVLLCSGAVCCLCTLHNLCYVPVYDLVRLYMTGCVYILRYVCFNFLCILYSVCVCCEHIIMFVFAC